MASGECCGKKHISVVTVGSCDSGKSTLCGRLLFELGKMNERELEKYRKETQEMGKASYLYAWHMDKSKDERVRSVTINNSYKDFETASNHYTLIDTAGHRDFINNAINGISCADVAILFVPARKGEFERSIQKGNHKKGELIGELRELSRICHISGVEQIIVCINKMDDPSVNYAQSRYDEIKSEVGKMLTRIGYKTKKIPFVPISGFKGDNLRDLSSKMAWYKGFTVKVKKDKISGYTLMDALEKVVKVPKRWKQKLFRMPLCHVYNVKNVGVVVAGRIEGNTIKSGQNVKLYPSGVEAIVKSIELNRKNINSASCGDVIGVNMQIKNERQIRKNDVMFVDDMKHDPDVRYIKRFTALLFVQDHPGQLKHARMEKPYGKSKEVPVNGWTPIIHIRTAKAPCVMVEIKWKMGKSTNNCKVESPSYMEAGDQVEVVFEPKLPIIVTPFDESKPFGRVIAMDTSLKAVGKVTRVETTKWEDYHGIHNKVWKVSNLSSRELRKGKVVNSSEDEKATKEIYGQMTQENARLKEELNKSQAMSKNDAQRMDKMTEMMRKIENEKDSEIVALEQRLNHVEHEYKEKYGVLNEEKRKWMDKNQENKRKVDQLQQTVLQLTKINSDLLKQQKEEKKEDEVAGFKNEIIFLDKKMKEFGNVYDENKLSIMYENDAESLNVKQELEELQFSNKSFGKTLQDISAYIQSITIPNVMDYEKWDVNMMILWIKTLDNGKYIKYCDVLKEGFISDGIENGEALLALDNQTDLRAAPFQIKSLPDRKGLIKHFQSLPTLKQKLMNNNENDDTVDKEGAITPYI